MIANKNNFARKIPGGFAAVQNFQSRKKEVNTFTGFQSAEKHQGRYF